MNSNVIFKFESSDGFLLNGMYYKSADANLTTCVVHIPGLAGNFYSSTYHPAFIEEYIGQGISYISINTRGSEYQKSIKNTQTGKSKMLGYTNEIFSDCSKDIEGIVSYVKNLGYKKIILQGHSSGCQKIIYSLSKGSLSESVYKVILLSPCDDIGLAHNHYGKDEFLKKIEFAESLKEDEEFLPQDFFFNLPLKKQSFISHFGKGNKFDIFSYYDKKNNFNVIKNNKIPTLVIFGEKDYVKDFGVIKDLYSSLDNYELKIIEDTGHKYKMKESELALILGSYAKQE